MTNAYLAQSRMRRFRKRRLRFYAWFLGVLVFAFFLFYAVRESSFFVIRTLKINGVSGAEQSNLLTSLRTAVAQETLGKILGADNYLAWPATLPPPSFSLASIAITKRFFDRSVEVAVQRKNIGGMWCFGDEAQSCFWFDGESALLLTPAPSTEGSLVQVIYEESSIPLTLGQPVLSSEEFAYFKEIAGVLGGMDFGDLRLVFNRDRRELTAIPVHGPELRFSVRFPSRVALAALREMASRPSFSNLQYADFTVNNKVYTK